MEVNRTDRMTIISENDTKLGGFKKFTQSYSITSLSKHNARVPDEKRRQLCGQIAGIIQELTSLPTLSDTDRRLLNISSAVALLLSGGR
jgi:hypothetical protein